MTAPERSARYVRTAGVVARRVAGEMLLVPVSPRTVDTFSRAAELFVLNATGEALWNALERPSTVEDLARNLIAAFEVGAEVARGDAAAFVAVMRDRGLIALVEEQGE